MSISRINEQGHGFRILKSSFVTRANPIHFQPALYLYGLLVSPWCFSICVNYYFQASFNLKVILYEAIIISQILACEHAYVGVQAPSRKTRKSLFCRLFTRLLAAVVQLEHISLIWSLSFVSETCLRYSCECAEGIIRDNLRRWTVIYNHLWVTKLFIEKIIYCIYLRNIPGDSYKMDGGTSRKFWNEHHQDRLLWAWLETFSHLGNNHKRHIEWHWPWRRNINRRNWYPDSSRCGFFLRLNTLRGRLFKAPLQRRVEGTRYFL